MLKKKSDLLTRPRKKVDTRIATCVLVALACLAAGFIAQLPALLVLAGASAGTGIGLAWAREIFFMDFLVTWGLKGKSKWNQ